MKASIDWWEALKELAGILALIGSFLILLWLLPWWSAIGVWIGGFLYLANLETSRPDHQD